MIAFDRGHVDWVEAHLDRKLSEPEAALVQLVCWAFRWGPWTVNGWHRLRQSGTGATYTTNVDLSTYDTDALTRLVLGAHETCHRLSIRGAGPSYLRLSLHPRVRGAGLMRGHPTIEEAIAAAGGAR